MWLLKTLTTWHCCYQNVLFLFKKKEDQWVLAAFSQLSFHAPACLYLYRCLNSMHCINVGDLKETLFMLWYFFLPWWCARQLGKICILFLFISRCLSTRHKDTWQFISQLFFEAAWICIDKLSSRFIVSISQLRLQMFIHLPTSFCNSSACVLFPNGFGLCMWISLLVDFYHRVSLDLTFQLCWTHEEVDINLP